MRDTIIIILAIAAIIALFGYINYLDISACIERGNSEQLCNHSFNR